MIVPVGVAAAGALSLSFPLFELDEDELADVDEVVDDVVEVGRQAVLPVTVNAGSYQPISCLSE